LQNSMILTPCCPKAGPMGGEGLAWPAGIWSLIWAITFFAIFSFSFVPAVSHQLSAISKIKTSKQLILLLIADR
jgi:hypothetical protein